MAEDDIVQKIRIEVEGGDKLDEQYKALADAAKKATDEIVQASKANSDGFDKVGEAADKAVESIGKIGEAATKLGDKLSGIGTEGLTEIANTVEKFGETATKSFDAALAAGQKFGDTTDALSKVGTAFDDLADKSRTAGETVKTASEGLADSSKAAEQAAEGIGKIGESVQGAGDDIVKLTEQFGSVAKAEDDLSAKTEDNATAVGDLKQSYDDVSTALQTVGTTATQTGEAFSQVSQSFAGIGEAADKAASSIGKVDEASKAALASLQQLNEALGNVGTASGTAAEGVEKAGTAAETSGEQIRVINVHVEDGIQFWSKFALEVANTGVSIVRLGAEFEAATGQVLQGVGQMGLGVAALITAVTYALTKVVDLGNGIAKALTPAIGEQSDALVKSELEYRRAVIELEGYSKASTQVAETVAKTSGEIDKSVGSLAKVADAGGKAADGITKIGDAANGIGSAFAESGLEGAKLYESLSNLSKATGQTIDNLQVGQQTFEHISVSAKAFGDTVLSIKEQLKDFDVGRALAASAREVEAATDKVDAANKRVLETQKALLEAQIKLEQSGGARASYDAAQRLADINRELLKLSSDRVTAEKSVRDAQNATADAANAAAEAQKAQAKAVATSLGTVVEQIRAVIAGQKDIKFDEAVTAERKITAIKVALSEVSQQAGASGVDVVAALVQIIAKTVDLKDALAIGKQFGLDEAAVRSIREYGDAVGNVANTLDRIPNLFQQIRAGGVAIGPEAAANFDKVKTSSEGLEDASLRLQKAWDALFPPTQKLEDFKTKSIELAKAQAEEIARQNELKANWINLGAAILEVGTKIGTTLIKPEFWSELGSKLSEMGGKFVKLFSDAGAAGSGFGSKVGSILSDIGAAFARLSQESGFAELWDRFTAASGRAFETVKQMWSRSAIGSIFENVVSVGQSGFQALSDWWNDNSLGFFDKFKGSFQQAMSSLGTGLEVVHQLLSGTLNPVWDGFVDAGKKAVDSITKFFSDLASVIGSWASEVWGKFSTAVGEALSSAITSIKSWMDSVGLTAFFESITKAAGDMANAVGQFFTDLGNAAKKLADDLGITDLFKGIIDSLDRAKAAVDRWLDEVSKAWFAAWGAMGEGVAKALEAIGFTSLAEKVRATANEWKGITTEATKAGEAATAAGNAATTAANASATAANKATEAQNKTTEAVKKTGDEHGKTGSAAKDGGDKQKQGADNAKQSFDDLAKKLQEVARQSGKSAQDIAKELGNIKPEVKAGDMLADIERNAKATVDRLKEMFKIEIGTVKPPDFTNLDKAAQDAIEKIKKAFADLDLSSAVKPPDWSKVSEGVADEIDKIKEKFSNLDFADSVKSIDWTKLTDGLDAELERVKQLFEDLDLSQSIKFDSVVDAAKQAGKNVADAFKEIDLSDLDLSEQLDFSGLTDAAQEAADSIEEAFQNIDISDTDFSEAMSFEDIVQAAEDAAQSIADAFGDIDISGSSFSDALRFEDIVQAAEDAASSVEGVFNDIDLSGFSAEISFDTITSAAETAAGQITQTFQAINLSSLSAITADFSGVIAAANAAVEQIKTAFQSIGTEGVAALVTSVQQAFEQISQQVQTTAQGISAAFSAIDFSGLINQIGQVVTAFQAMEAAAYAAAQASREAAAAASSAAAAGSRRYGGLFRGLPGNDTNLVWLTDMEFVMRPEAVAKYGIGFMDMINSMTFPTGGYREGGLHRVMHSISAFRDGGLNTRAIMIPAFRAGGVNEGNGNGNGKDRSANMRPLNLTIGTEAFKGLLAPEDTAKAMERASVGRQLTATGTRPRWNK